MVDVGRRNVEKGQNILKKWLYIKKKTLRIKLMFKDNYTVKFFDYEFRRQEMLSVKKKSTFTVININFLSTTYP